MIAVSRLCWNMLNGRTNGLKLQPVTGKLTEWIVMNEDRFPEFIWGLPEDANQSSRGLYDISADKIYVNAYATDEIEIGHTVFHELIHSTVHSSRLDLQEDFSGTHRNHYKTSFNNFDNFNPTAYEECVAEIGASMLMILICETAWEQHTVDYTKIKMEHLHETAKPAIMKDALEAVEWLL